MPRLPPALRRKAYRISPSAAALLPACRDLPSALNELRWIREHVYSSPRAGSPEQRVRQLCRDRGRGVPLQYVLGTQPFGNLEMVCRPGVLIPRPEPEAYATHLAGLLKKGMLRDSPRRHLSILDLCTGTGCIALLLYSMLQSSFPKLRVHGVDISKRAISLARENVQHNIRKGHLSSAAWPGDLQFYVKDIFADDWASLCDAPSWDVITCNPPYISHHGFAHDTARSVRNYEPKLAQVPLPRQGYQLHMAEDVFYARLLDIAALLRPQIVLCEVGGLEQAVRVVELVLQHSFSRAAEIEIWADLPDVRREPSEQSSLMVLGRSVVIRGSGHGRSIFINCKREKELGL